MEMIADALLIAGATGAALYCRVLAQRLNALKNMDSGVGAAIAQLSRQVDDMRLSLESAKNVSGDQSKSLSQMTARAEMAAGRLELLLAALHENGKQRPLSVRREGGARKGETRSTVAQALAAFEAAPPVSVARPAAGSGAAAARAIMAADAADAVDPGPEAVTADAAAVDAFTPAQPTHWGAAP